MTRTKKIVATALSAAMAASMCVAVPATAAFAADANGAATATDGTQDDAAKATPFDESTMKFVGSQFYTGKEIKPYSGTWNAKGNWGKLKEGTDYTVEYKDNIDKGTATATITGIGKYSGTIVKTFDIIEFYINVSYTNSEGKKVSLGTLDKAQIDKLLKDSTDNTKAVNYMYGDASKGYTVLHVPAKSYLTYDSVMRAVGVSAWKTASGVGTDGFAGDPVSNEMNTNGKFYAASTPEGIVAEGAEAAPAAITFANSSAEVKTTAAEAANEAAAKDPTEEVKIAVGATDENVKSGTVAGRYFATGICQFVISDYTMLKSNPVKVAKAKATVKKGKSVAVKVSKAQGKVTVSTSAKKVAKVSYSKKTGKVTIKGLKKGTAKVAVKAAGNKTYKAGTKTIKVTVK